MSQATQVDYAIASAALLQWYLDGRKPPPTTQLLDIEYAGEDPFLRQTAAKQELLLKALTTELGRPWSASAAPPRAHVLSAVRAARVPLTEWTTSPAVLRDAIARALAVDPSPDARALLASIVADGRAPAAWSSTLRSSIATGLQTASVMPWSAGQRATVTQALAAAARAVGAAPSTSAAAAPAWAVPATSASSTATGPGLSLGLKLALVGGGVFTVGVMWLLLRRSHSRADRAQI